MCGFKSHLHPVRHRRQPTFPSINETLNHPAFPSTIWALEPHSHGKVSVAHGRGGPVGISWEIHGQGPVKLVLIMGLAGLKVAWQRQTKYFGHDRGDKYSVLIIDNRGMGGSDKPLGVYSTSGMAMDIIEVIDHVGWTAERDIHVVGISLGGMIAQEVAIRIPTRLLSLALICTSGRVVNTKGYWDTITERFSMFVPKSMERSIVDTALRLFAPEWLAAPDDEALPEPGVTARCGPPPPETGPTYRLFDSNFQRFQAQELYKKRNPELFSQTMLMCQLAAAGLHNKTDEQLREIAEGVGSDRILVMHGKRDNMITFPNGERLVKMLQPGNVRYVDDMGHAPIMERTQWFNSVLEEHLTMMTKPKEE
ncbi:alpha beta hydrolase [Fusarium heterosporum]|uniref:Alpha beta hydrolase n=1 Tax=Fusarium heterosporum TaxID=42747 RepID=A0A8H5TAC0_FUSHE|nr:alpha beta hydrolase [Fusarium heterosporum]